MINLAAKVAIVTGGASGIGAATATILAQRGAAVVVADINRAGAEAVVAEIHAAGGRAVASVTDMGEEDQIRDMVELAVSTFGGLDILHNNAALLTPEVTRLGKRDLLIADADADLFALILKINVIGPTLATKYAVPHMIARGGGSIINTTSDAGILGELVRPMYGTSKAALIGLTRNIATQYGRYNIRSVAVSPGVTLTPAVKQSASKEAVDAIVRHSLVPRAGTAEDLAYMVAFLVSDEASYISGITIPVDGGLLSHFPNYAEELARGVVG